MCNGQWVQEDQYNIYLNHCKRNNSEDFLIWPPFPWTNYKHTYTFLRVQFMITLSHLKCRGLGFVVCFVFKRSSFNISAFGLLIKKINLNFHFYYVTLYNGNLLLEKTCFLPFSYGESCIHERIKREAGEKVRQERSWFSAEGKKKKFHSVHSSSARKCLYEKVILIWKYIQLFLITAF